MEQVAGMKTLGNNRVAKGCKRCGKCGKCSCTYVHICARGRNPCLRRIHAALRCSLLRCRGVAEELFITCVTAHTMIRTRSSKKPPPPVSSTYPKLWYKFGLQKSFRLVFLVFKQICPAAGAARASVATGGGASVLDLVLSLDDDEGDL